MSNEQQLISKDESYYGYLSGWISIFGNVILFAVKFWVGTISGSIAIIADAWHTLTDSLSSILLLIGIKLSKKPADKKHPFGHGRIEFLTSLFIAVMLGVIAFNFIMESFEKLSSRELTDFNSLTIIVMIISIIGKEALAQLSFWAGKKSGRNSVKADGWHHRTDAISSAIILIGIFVSPYAWWIDGVLGLFISALIGFTAYKIMKDAMSSIIGEAPDPEMIYDIITTTNDTAGADMYVHDIHLHNYGLHKELTFHVKLPKKMDIEHAYSITEKIEKIISHKFSMITTIKIEPKKK